MPDVPATARPWAALTWPVKESFLAYVRRMGGRVTIVRPAYPGEHGFAFPHAPAPGTAQPRELTFTGGVAFSAHGGALDITLAEPVLVADEQGILLTVAAPARPEGGTRAVIAVLAGSGLTQAPGDEAVALVPRLTEDGSALFGGVYPPGETMDPLVVPGSLLAPVSRTRSGLDADQ